MTSVFMGGSREIKHLSAAVTARLENIIANHHQVFIGDASGVDKLVQRYLADRDYDNVVVYCTGNKCRNNVGNWEIRNVAANEIQKGFEFYAVKDLQMANDADCGFMLWDMKSKGTLNNLLNLRQGGKKSLVWLEAENVFYTIRNKNDLVSLLEKCAAKDLENFEEKIGLSKRLDYVQIELAFA